MKKTWAGEQTNHYATAAPQELYQNKKFTFTATTTRVVAVNAPHHYYNKQKQLTIMLPQFVMVR